MGLGNVSRLLVRAGPQLRRIGSADAVRAVRESAFAVVAGLVVGAIIIESSGMSWADAYSALVKGAFGGRYSIAETLITATPLMLLGLTFALSLLAGLFNVGAEGQFAVGALAATFVGYSLSMPMWLHVPFAILVGALAGGLWGSVPGTLKARFGAHEVISTVMMNYISFQLLDYLTTGPMHGPTELMRTPLINPSAQLPIILQGTRLHAGLLITLLVVVLTFYLIWRTTIGFEITLVGRNPIAARFAGVPIPRVLLTTMVLGGALSGIGGAIEVMGIDHAVPQSFLSGKGFDGISVAILGQGHPVGVVMAALLFGALRSGAITMEGIAGVPGPIVSMIQGVIVVFAGSLMLFRWIASSLRGAVSYGRIN